MKRRKIEVLTGEWKPGQPNNMPRVNVRDRVNWAVNLVVLAEKFLLT